jgi:hypothetical protein
LFVIPQRSGGICFVRFQLRCILCDMNHATQRVLFCLSLFAVVLVIGCNRQKPTLGSGDEWRSWKPNQKRSYIVGFVDGWSTSSSKACDKIDDFTTIAQDNKADPSHKFDNVLPLPSARCREASDKFSKEQLSGVDQTSLRGMFVDVSVYTNVLDDFYRHPECRPMPYSILLAHLNDNEFKSGEDLYKFVRSGPGWGFFSGFDGIEKCLPGYQ